MEGNVITMGQMGGEGMPTSFDKQIDLVNYNSAIDLRLVDDPLPPLLAFGGEFDMIDRVV